MAKRGASTVVPRLRFPEFRNGPEWELRELGPMTSKVGSGITPLGGEQNYKTEGRPFVRSQNVGWAELLLDDVAYIDEEKHRTFDSTEIEERDVLLNITGASIGRSVVADSRIAGGNVNQHVCIIRVKPNDLNPALLNQYLISDCGQKQIDSFQAGGNRQGLNFAQIRSFEVPLAPLEREQQKIADCLTSLDEVIAAQGRKVEALKAHKRGLMQQLFPCDGETRPRLRFPEFHDAPEWKQKLGSALFENRKEGGEEGLPIYSVTTNDGMVPRASFDRDFYDIEDPAKNKKACKDDVAYNMMRMWQGAQGVVPEDCMVSPAYVVLSPLEGVYSSFFAYLFKLPQSLELLTAYSRGLTKDRLRLYFVDFARMPLCVPGRKEQKRIADCLSSLDAQITTESNQLTTLKTHKQGLMQQLFPAPEAAGS